jgi:two-component system, NarL family, response regulator DevR
MTSREGGSRSGTGESDTVTRVFVVDDHDLVRRGLSDLIGFEDDMAVCGEAESVASACREIARHPADVAVVDMMLSDGTGIEVCRWIGAHQPATICLIITSLDDTTALRATILAGAVGYVSKLSAGTDAVVAIRRAAAGTSLLDPTLLATGQRDLLQICTTGERLDGAERQLLALALDGLTDDLIAITLGTTAEDVAKRMRVALDKTELIRARSRTAVPAATPSL